MNALQTLVSRPDGAASPPPTPGGRVRRLLAILLVFLVVGPPVGAIVFMMTLALIGLGRGVDLEGLAWVAMFAVIYGGPISYLIGAAPAAVAGLAVGIRQAFFGRMGWPLAVALGVVIGIGFLVASGQPVVPGNDSSVQPEHGPVMIATCLASTMACWALVRNWYFDAPANGAKA